MSINNQVFSTNVRSPFMVYGYIEDKNKCTNINVFDCDSIQEDIRGNELNFELGIIGPYVFINMKHLKRIKAYVRNFDNNSNQTTSFEIIYDNIQQA